MARQLPPEVVERFLERHRALDAAAGLPPKITDTAVLDRIASIVVASRRRPLDIHNRRRVDSGPSAERRLARNGSPTTDGGID